MAVWATSAGADIAGAKAFAAKHVLPMLEDRKGLYEISFADQADGSTSILLKSAFNRVTLGTYDIRLKNSGTLPASAPAVEMTFKEDPKGNYIGLSGRLDLPLNPQGDPSDSIRGLLRADFLLSPQMKAPDRAATMSSVQKDVLRQMQDFALQNSPSGTRALMILPTGIGKTVISAEFAKWLTSRDTKPYKIVYVVQSQEILKDAAKKFSEILGLSPGLVQHNYGTNSREKLFAGAAKLVVTTRTGMTNSLNEVRDREDFQGRVIYVIDEAHHAGAEDGEFQKIISTINSVLLKGDAMIGMTATPWHTDNNIIDRIFKGNVATAFITKAEREKFIKDGQYVLMARLMLFRAMAAGYLSPIRNYEQIRYLDDTQGHALLSRKFLNDAHVKFQSTDEKSRGEMLQKEVTAHVPLLKNMIEQILKVTRVDRSKRRLAPNRGIIFVPSIAHANIYAELLNRLSPSGADRIEARPYHSKLEDVKRTENMKWIRDEIPGGQHKYILAVRALGEGVDIPGINHLILTQTYSENDFIGMRELIQNLGRAARLSRNKTDFTMTDYTGDARRLLFENMDQSLIEKMRVEGGILDFEPYERATRETKVLVDYQTLREEALKAETVVVPVEKLTVAPAVEEAVTTPRTSSVAETKNDVVKRVLGEGDQVTSPHKSQVASTDALLAPMSWETFIRLPGSMAFLARQAGIPLRRTQRTNFGASLSVEKASTLGIAAFKKQILQEVEDPEMLVTMLESTGLIDGDDWKLKDLKAAGRLKVLTPWSVADLYARQFIWASESGSPFTLRNLNGLLHAGPADWAREVGKMKDLLTLRGLGHDALARKTARSPEAITAMTQYDRYAAHDQMFRLLSWDQVTQMPAFFSLYLQEKEVSKALQLKIAKQKITFLTALQWLQGRPGWLVDLSAEEASELRAALDDRGFKDLLRTPMSRMTLLKPYDVLALEVDVVNTMAGESFLFGRNPARFDLSVMKSLDEGYQRDRRVKWPLILKALGLKGDLQGFRPAWQYYQAHWYRTRKDLTFQLDNIHSVTVHPKLDRRLTWREYLGTFDSLLRFSREAGFSVRIYNAWVKNAHIDSLLDLVEAVKESSTKRVVGGGEQSKREIVSLLQLFKVPMEASDPRLDQLSPFLELDAMGLIHGTETGREEPNFPSIVEIESTVYRPALKVARQRQNFSLRQALAGNANSENDCAELLMIKPGPEMPKIEGEDGGPFG